MKFSIRIVILSCILLANTFSSFAQEETLSKDYKEKAVLSLNKLMNEFYVFPEVAKETEMHLLQLLEKGHFNQFESNESFAEALTKSVQSINKDKHMRVRPNRPYQAQENTPERWIEQRLDRINGSRRGNLGFTSLEMLEGNVAYLDLRGFAGMGRGMAKVDSYMQLMAEADAVIIDLSKNGGGSPNMVQYLCSYFFDTKVHLNSLYWREGDVTTEFWTLDEVGGEKMPDVPLFVITSSRTFSAAEEFSYNMQTQKRATLVGQTSGGGANPGGTRNINDDLWVFIPTGKAINPITNTNWEGVGVIPEVKTEVEGTKDKAHELAKDAAEEFRSKRKAEFTKLFTELNNQFDNFSEGNSEKVILKTLNKNVEAGFLGEDDINTLGYEYLMEHKKPDVAEAIFEANTILNPNSANVFDSYGEVLMMKGDFKASIKNYQKAVDNAIKNDDQDLEFYKKNLEKVRSKMKEAK